MLKYREYKEKGIDHFTISRKVKSDDDYDAAIKYKGKIYKGYIHDIALQKMKDAGISQKEIDDNLDIDDFGYVVNDKFIAGDSDAAKRLNWKRKNISGYH